MQLASLDPGVNIVSLDTPRCTVGMWTVFPSGTSARQHNARPTRTEKQQAGDAGLHCFEFIDLPFVAITLSALQMPAHAKAPRCRHCFDAWTFSSLDLRDRSFGEPEIFGVLNANLLRSSAVQILGTEARPPSGAWSVLSYCSLGLSARDRQIGALNGAWPADIQAGTGTARVGNPV